MVLMNRGRYEWHARPPNFGERIGAGVFLILLLLAIANHIADWGIFGNYDKQVAAGLVLLGVVLIHLLPGVRRQ